MKKIIALAFVGTFLLIGSSVSAATCEVKTVCMDSMRLGMQTGDCKIISAEDFSRQMATAFGADSSATYSCYVGCKDGACIDDNAPDVCTDTDGGKDYFVKGTASTKGHGEQAASSDVCSDKDTLSEVSCEKEVDSYDINVASYKCPNGCLNGACIKTASGGTGSTCTDSDGGKDIFKAGVIKINGKELDLADTCGPEPQTIEEEYCLPNGTHASEELKCPGLCEILPGTYGHAYCTKTCEKSEGYYCHKTADGKIGIAFLTPDCKWEKATPCQSGACGYTCSSAGNLIDTDGDGLLDTNEAKWGTDPKKFDTDGDGYGDMTEISSGYNPLGAGKFTMAQATLASDESVSSSTAVTSTVADLSTSTATGTFSSTISDVVPGKSASNNSEEMSDFVNQNPALAYVIFGLIFLLIIALYVYMAICLQFIARKLHVSGVWMAWIPVANIFLIIKCADRPYWWFLLFFVPILNIVVGVLLWVYICQRLGHPGWLAILMLISPLNLIVMGYLAFANSNYQMDYSNQSQDNSDRSLQN